MVPVVPVAPAALVAAGVAAVVLATMVVQVAAVVLVVPAVMAGTAAVVPVDLQSQHSDVAAARSPLWVAAACHQVAEAPEDLAPERTVLLVSVADRALLILHK